MTTHNEHTAGPWVARETIKAHDGYPATWQIDGENHAICTTQFCYAQETEANARLIASAPTLLAQRDALLEALEAMVTDAERIGIEDGLADQADPEAVERARQALRHAKGDS